ncbi:mRNA-decapping enzyme subunit 2 [Folsomia candida]|nr:mRNA-decapping enzyme subunit 2 [Folsomia candida]
MSFNYVNSLPLGGLMGASPYSNVQILDAFTLQQHQQHLRQNHLYQQYQQRSYHRSNSKGTPNSSHHYQQTPSLSKDQLLQPLINSTPPVIKFRLPDRVIQDVLCRFIMNIPEEEKFDPVRALFQVELAHWFFIDHYCTDEGDPALASLGHIPFNQFAYIIFKEAPHLRQYYENVDKYLADFRTYRSRVPTYGAILMNQDLTQVVLVQGFRNQWGFPKGKVNENEDPIECAIREVFEETGYNMRPLINPNHFIESKTHDRNDRLYLVRGVDTQFPFFPQTQYEIKQISWFNIDEIPEHKKDTNPKISGHGQAVSNFFTIYTYVKRLKQWIADKLEGRNRIQCFRSKYFNQNQEEEENCTLEETYSLQSEYTINTPSQSYHLTSNLSGALSSVPGKNGDELIRVLGGMRITSSQDDGDSFHKTPGNISIGSGKKKGANIKKRLFEDNSIISQDSQQVSSKDAANFLSMAMGIPVTNNHNGNNSSKSVSTSLSISQSSPFFGKLPSSVKTSTPNVAQAASSSIQASQIKNKHKHHEYINSPLTAKSWDNFEFDKDKLMKALQIGDPPP